MASPRSCRLLRGPEKNATLRLQMADGATQRKRGMPRGRRKGYTRPNRDRTEMLARKPAATNLHGIVGKVPKLYELIDQRLEAMDWNWSRLAEEIPCSRQYLIDMTDKDTIPADAFYRLCQVLDLKASDLIQPLDHE